MNTEDIEDLKNGIKASHDSIYVFANLPQQVAYLDFIDNLTKD